MGAKEEILAFDDRASVEIEVPEWGGRKVCLQEMSAGDRDQWELDAAAQVRAGGRPKHVRAGLVARCMVDETGARVFDDAQIEDLSKKSAKALDRLYDACTRLNALTKEEAKAVEGN